MYSGAPGRENSSFAHAGRFELFIGYRFTVDHSGGNSEVQVSSWKSRSRAECRSSVDIDPFMEMASLSLTFVRAVFSINSASRRLCSNWNGSVWIRASKGGGGVFVSLK